MCCAVVLHRQIRRNSSQVHGLTKREIERNPQETIIFFFTLYLSSSVCLRSRRFQRITRDKTTELFNDSRKKNESNSQIVLPPTRPAAHARLRRACIFDAQELTIPYRIPVIRSSLLQRRWHRSSLSQLRNSSAGHPGIGMVVVNTDTPP